MTLERITCHVCQSPFEWEHDDDLDGWIMDMTRPIACPCCVAKQEADKADKQRVERDRRRKEAVYITRRNARKYTPEVMRESDIEHPLFHKKGWEQLKSWRPTMQKPWMGIIGAESGTSKSRIAFQLASEVAETMAETMLCAPTLYFITSYDLTATVRKLTSNTFTDQHKAQDKLKKMREASLLLVDDLGKGRLSPMVAEELFAILNHRSNHGLAMIWTSNSTPDEICSHMSDDIREPMIRRLREFSKIVRFVKNK